MKKIVALSLIAAASPLEKRHGDSPVGREEVDKISIAARSIPEKT